MSNTSDKSQGTPEGPFYDGSVLDEARERLVALVARRESPIVVTGEPGVGKSVLIRRVVKTLSARDQPILLTYPRLDFQDVLDIVLKSLRIDNAASAVNANQPRGLDFVRWYLRKESVQGRYVTLFFDEAHDLGMDLLKNLFQLAQPPIQGNPFLGLVFVGLPALEVKLAQAPLHDLLRAKPFLFRLRPLNAEETTGFVRHYFSAMGMQSAQLISTDAVTRVWDYSRGVPSLTNRLCAALLVVTKKKGISEIDEKTVEEAAALCSTSLDRPGYTGNSADGGDRQANQTRAGVASDALVKDSAQHSLHVRAPAQNYMESDNQPIAPSISREAPMDRTASLNKILKNLQNGAPDVEASALITEDGLMIASSLPQDLDEITVGGMSATLLSLGTRAASELRRGDVKEVIVRGEEGYGVLVSAGRGVLLLVVANESAKLGLIFFDMRAAINAIKKVL